jgi:phosphocarrier protein
MYTKNVTINNEVGLHARPATFFIQKANEFKSGIWVEKDERRVNAKSLLGVLSLGIVQGTEITLLADGTAAFSYSTEGADDSEAENDPRWGGYEAWAGERIAARRAYQAEFLAKYRAKAE